ncbi:MAG: polyketide synthase dehydratase domain-containing protein, partial [Clostridium sp.]|nr:polyketide synthase dehydratase domain-containing protein [Clostridium sp.]
MKETMQEVLDALRRKEIGKEEAFAKIKAIKDQNTLESGRQKKPDLFKREFTYNEPYLQAHIIFGKQVLLGVTNVSIAIEALKERISSLETMHLHRIVFQKPLVMEAGKASITVRVKEGKEKYVFENYVKKNSDVEFLSISGEVVKGNVPVVEQFDYENFVANGATPISESKIENNPMLKRTKVLNAVHEVYSKDDIAAGILILSDDIINATEPYMVHPAILDSGFIVGGASLSEELISPLEGEGMWIPFMIKDIYVLGEIPRRSICKTQFLRATDDLLVLSFSVFNEDGELLLLVNELTFKFTARNVAIGDKKKVAFDLLESIKEYLTESIAQELQEDKKQIWRNRNFMEMGIESNSLIHLSSQLEEELGVELYPTIFFEYQTIDELSNYLESSFQQPLAVFFSRVDKEELFDDAEQVIEAETATEGFMEQEEKVSETQNETNSENNSVMDQELDRIAVIGMSLKFPMSDTPEEFWENLKNSKDMITEIPKDHWDVEQWFDEDPAVPNKTYSKWGSFIEPDKFDPVFFGITPREAEWMDPQLRILLEKVQDCIDDAGYGKRIHGTNTGLFLATTFHEYWDEIMRDNTPITDYQAVNSVAAALAGRVSYLYDLQGISIPIDNACASSLTALHLAKNSLLSGECDMALVAGVNLLLSPVHYIFTSKAKALSPTGHCYAFDEKANGYVPGEGVAVLLLKSLKKAKEDGDQIHAVIRGTAVNHVGRANNPTSPRPELQIKMLKEAWKDAKVRPEQISYIEAHGTGTKLGDPIEFNSLRTAFGDLNGKRNFCSLGSVKAHIGHLEAAAGLAGVIRTILSMKNKQIPAMPHFEHVNPLIDIENSPFYINQSLVNWETELGTPRRAGVSSFGMAGHNAHVVLEEYVKEEKTITRQDSYLFILSAKNEERLQEYASLFIRYFEQRRQKNASDDILSSATYTLQVGREEMEYRLAIIANSERDLYQKLSGYCMGNEEENDVYYERVAQMKLDREQTLTEEVMLALEEKNMQLLAKKWVSGSYIEWCELYKDGKPDIVSLPSYPFARERYWKKNPDRIENTSMPTAREVLHPLIDSNISTFDSQQYYKFFTKEDFCIEEHQVAGKRVLPGVAYLEMARITAELSQKNAVVESISNMVWVKTAVLSDEHLPVYVELYPEGANATVVFKGEDEEQYAQGKVKYRDSQSTIIQPVRILDKILERCGQLKHGEDFYSQYRELGLIYGPSYCVMKKIWSCDGEAIAYLQLSDERKQGMSQYVLHPAMMDGALQVITGIPSKDQAKQLYLPFSIGKLTIYEKVSSACYVHAKTAKDYGSNKTFTIEILDENGNVLIAIEDFLMRAAWLDSQDEVQEYYLYQKGAKPAEQDVFDDGNKAGKIVAFVTNSVTREELLKHFEDVVIINRGEGYQKKSPYEFVVNQSCEEEYKRVFHELPWKPSAVVYLWADAGEEAVNNVEFQILNSFYSVFYCIRQYISMENVSDMHFLYAYARAKELPCNGAVEAFLKSVHFENVKFKWKMVGLDDLRSGEIEESLKKEYIGLIHQDGQHIFYQQKVRYQTALLQAKDKEESGQGIVLRKNGTYILAGGKGKLGTNLANYLRAKEDIQLVILGRGQQDEWMKDASGIEFIPTDLSNEDEVASAIAHIKVNHKEINGVFQCAGACQDAYMKDKDVAACERVLGAKVKGTFYLDKYTKEEPIDYFVVYSSLAGITGNIGQCDYAYANNFLNELGSYREQNNHPGKTMIVNWPYWKDGGMTISKASEQMMMKTLGLKPITNEIGMELLEASMDVDGNNCLPLIGDYQKFKQVLFEEDRKVDCGKTDGVRENVQHKQGFPEDKKLESLIRDGVIADVSSILRVNEKDIDVYAEMNEFGFDSITFTEFGNLLNEKYGTNIIPSVFFEHTTLLSFIQYLQEDYKKEFQKYYQLDLADVKNQQDIEQAKNNEQSKEMPDVSAMRTCRVRKEKSVRFDVQDKAVSANRTVVNNSDDNEEIAIIGMSGIMPDSDNMDEFWDNLIAGRDMVSEIPADRWDYHKYYGDPITERNKTNVKYAGFMRNVDKFDPAFFGISPLEAELMDPQQRIFLETTWNTILDAGYNPEDLSDSYTGVFVGVGGLDYLELIRESETDIQAQSSTGISHCLVPNRVSFFFNFHGPSEPVNTACSSSLVAIHNAVRSIQRGECEQAIAGGVNVIASPSTFISFSKAGMLASDGKCKTFDKDANGYVRGEGSGAVMLKKLSKAKEDGDHIYAVVKGSAINHGGRAASLTAPNTKAQAELIVKAWKDAKVDPSTVTYIEAHGTGTSLGDPVEVNGLKKAFSILYQEAGKKIEPHTCGIGSVKSNIGHLETAAGIASVMKVVLAMQHKKIPKTIHFKEQNPYIDFTESPFYVVSAPEEWTCQRDEEGLEIPRRAGISSFGFGGVNSHLVLEEYREADNTALQETSQPVLIPLSARTKEQLRESVRRLIAYIENRQLTKISKEGCKDALQLKIKECVAAILNVEKDTVQTEDTLEELGFGQVEVVKLVQQMNRIIKSEITDTQLTIDDSIDTIVELLVKVVDKEELAVYQTELKAESESEEKSFDLNLVNIAFTLQCGRSAMAERVVFIVKSVKELVDSLNKYLDEDNQPKNCFSGNIKKNKEFCELLGDGEESESFVKYIIEHRNFEKLAKLWALGLDVKWSVLYDSERVQRVSLPGYPFLEQRCWIGNQLVEPQEDCFYTDSSELANEAELSEENLQEKAESILCKLIGKELKIPSNVIEKDTEFCELGLDSINVNQLNGKMKELFPDIPATVYFTYKSVDALAEYLVSQYHEELKFLHEGEYAVVTKNNQSQKCAEKIESPQETVVSKVSKESSKMICERTECNATSKETNMDIAIIGLSGRYPMGDNLDVFWDNLWNGQDGIEEIPMERWDYHKYESDSGKAKSGMYCKWGGFLHDIDKFDSQFFHISPTESKFIDPQERLFIEASWSCVEEAGYTTETLKKKYDKEECCPVGVFAGVTFNNYQLYAVDGSGNKQLPVNSQIFSVANRVSYLMNFSGPSLSVDTACSS